LSVTPIIPRASDASRTSEPISKHRLKLWNGKRKIVCNYRLVLSDHRHCWSAFLAATAQEASINLPNKEFFNLKNLTECLGVQKRQYGRDIIKNLFFLT